MHPGTTIKDLADAFFLTRRTIWGLVGDLRRAGTLRVRKEGRRHHYTVNLEAPFIHPCLHGVTLREVLGRLAVPAMEADRPGRSPGSLS
jgi:hypothetical protein